MRYHGVYIRIWIFGNADVRRQGGVGDLRAAGMYARLPDEERSVRQLEVGESCELVP